MTIDEFIQLFRDRAPGVDWKYDEVKPGQYQYGCVIHVRDDAVFLPYYSRLSAKELEQEESSLIVTVENDLVDFADQIGSFILFGQSALWQPPLELVNGHGDG